MSRSVKSIGVIGLGLIGASILKDFKRHAPGIARYGVSKGAEQVVALREGLIKTELNFEDFVEACDLIIIATPINEVVPTAIKISESVKQNRKSGLIVTDVASVKDSIAPAFAELSSDAVDFIPSHPMGGSEKSGYQASHGGMFRAKPWIICATEHSKNVENLAQLLGDVCGARIQFLNPNVHDAYVAVVSHMVIDLSHLLFDFISRKHSEALKVAGESFITTTRLASDNPTMIAGIHTHNMNNIREVLTEFLEYAEQVVNQDNGLSQDYFERNKFNRDNWLHYRNKQA